MGQSDRQCVRQCLNGHPDEYGQLVRRYQTPLLSYLAGRLGDTERAEEVAQETFVRGYFALNRLERSGSFFSWLIGIANRVAKEQHRSQRREREMPESAVAAPVPAEQSGDRDLKRAVAELPQPYAEVVTLRYYGGLSCAQVGERLNVPLGTVTKRLSRAYGMLRESLGEQAGQDD